MNNAIKQAIEKYQCPGCVVGYDTKCGRFEQETTTGWCGVQCTAHVAGTTLVSAGQIYREFLGMPKGFNRCHNTDNTEIVIHQKLEDHQGFNMWNVPVWKHLNAAGHTLVRMFSPRQNRSTILIFLENCVAQIECLEITKEQIDAMD